MDHIDKSNVMDQQGNIIAAHQSALRIISALVINGLQTDGPQHKQYILEKVMEIADPAMLEQMQTGRAFVPGSPHGDLFPRKLIEEVGNSSNAAEKAWLVKTLLET